MAHISFKDIVVQRLVRSPFARKYYRMSPQRKPIATISLDDIHSLGQLFRFWKEIVGIYGNFSLSARSPRTGRFVKTIAVMRVSRFSGIVFKDARCVLNSKLRREREIRENDMEI